MLVFGALVAILAIYAWSRTVEGRRRAKDRAITMAIATAFGVAMAPLISLLYEVIKRGAAASTGNSSPPPGAGRSVAAAPSTRSSAR